MSVNPGFGGQKFIENTYAKVKEIKQLADAADKNILIEIDGGVNGENAPLLVKAGANMLVAGSYVFNSMNPSQTIQSLKNP
jgi:ribulose-phosphate 3-epimerase